MLIDVSLKRRNAGLAAATLVLLILMLASGCGGNNSKANEKGTPEPPANQTQTSAENTSKAFQPVSLISIFKVMQFINPPPTGQFSAPPVPMPHTVAGQAFYPGDRLYVLVTMNPQNAVNISFTKYTFFSEETGQEETLTEPPEKGEFGPGGIFLLGHAAPWVVPEKPGKYEIRIYIDKIIAASGEFDVVPVTYPRHVGLDQANVIANDYVPTPSYLPGNFTFTEIHQLEHSVTTEEFAITYYPKGQEAWGVTNFIKAPILLDVALYRNGQVGGLKLIGDRYDINGDTGVLVTGNATYDVWWIKNYHQAPGQYEIHMRATKDLTKDEVLKIARSISGKYQKPTAATGANISAANTGSLFSTGEAVLDLLPVGDDIWAGTSNGVVRCDLKTGTFKRYTTADGLGSDVAAKLALDSHGNVWTTNRIAGVSRFDGTKWTNFKVQDGLISNDVITLAADRQGGVWVSAYWGVSYWDGNKWESFTNLDPKEPIVGGSGNPNNQNATVIKDGQISAADVIVVDSRDSVWFSARGGGATRFDGQNWTYFSTEVGVPRGVSAISQDKNGNVWFGGWTGVARFDGTNFEALPIKEYQSIIPRPFVEDIFQDNHGNIWVAAYGGGISRYDGRDWYVFTSEDGLAAKNAKKIFEGKDGSIGVITDQGVYRFNNVAWQLITTKESLPNGAILTVVSDNSGNLWFGTDKGEIKRFQ